MSWKMVISEASVHRFLKYTVSYYRLENFSGLYRLYFIPRRGATDTRESGAQPGEHAEGGNRA